MDSDPWATSTDDAAGVPESPVLGEAPSLRAVPSDGDPWSSGFSSETKQDDPMTMAALDAALPVAKRPSVSAADPWAGAVDAQDVPTSDFAAAPLDAYEVPSSSWHAADGFNDWSPAPPLSSATPVRLDSPDPIPAPDPYAQPVAISSHPSNSPTVRPVISPLPSRINLTPPALDDDSDGGGFGGFNKGAAADDSFGSWGGEEDAWDEPGASDEPLPSWNAPDPTPQATDEGWAAPSLESPAKVGADDDDWHAAQQEIERRDARAPVEKVRELEQTWRKVVADAMAQPPTLDFDGSGLALVGNTMTQASSTVDSLSELPPSATGFRTPYRSSLTHAQYVQWLSSATLSPANSLLARVIQEHSRINARRRSQDVAEWDRRSKLGEQEERATAQTAQATRPGWGFWRRQPSQASVPLTTSGGSMLEAKKVDPPPPSSLPLESTISASSSQASGAAAGGFFGRFRRGRAASPSIEAHLDKEVELSSNDLSYLAEVPSMHPRPATHDFSDLLSLDDAAPAPANRPATLEQVLGNTSQSGSLGRMPQSTLMPRAAPLAPPAKKASPFDGLLDLDFSPSASPSQTPATSTRAAEPFAESFLTATSMPPANPVTQMVPGPSKPPPTVAQPSLFDDDDGFGDFADSRTAPAHPSTNGSAAFDFSAFESAQTTSKAPDPFGDFSAFETAAPRNAPASRLVIDAAAKSGRWPSPISPIPELLPPPPRAQQDPFDFGL